MDKYLIDYLDYPTGLSALVALNKPNDGIETDEYRHLCNEYDNAIKAWEDRCLKRRKLYELD